MQYINMIDLAMTLTLCYRALHTSPNVGFTGSMLLYHPILSQAQYKQRDAEFRRVCCATSQCNRYYQRRIVNDCTGYIPPVIGMIFLGNGIQCSCILCSLIYLIGFLIYKCF